MLIKFFPRGRGCGSGPVDYVCGPHDHHGQERVPAPKILYGDPAVIRQVIDSVPHKFKYTSGVISFAPEDNPTPDQLEEVILDFERAAFPDFDGNRYSILWVLHKHAGRVELHFVTPRIELTTGKAYNPAPPNWQARYDLLRDYFNFKFGWARPDDPDRARPLQPGLDALIGADAKRKGQNSELSCKESIAQKILEEAHAGKIHHRKDVVHFLRKEGFSLPRIGKDYITIINPADGKRHRLKGLFFNEDFSAKNFLNRQSPVNIIDPQKAADAQKNLNKKILKIAAYNQNRYPQKENVYDRRTTYKYGPEAQKFGRTADQGFPIVERRNDRFELPCELHDYSCEHTTGSGGRTFGVEEGRSLSGYTGRQNSESQDVGGSRQFSAAGNNDYQKYTPRSIASVYLKFLNALFAEIRSLQSDTVFLRKAAMQKKLKSMPKVAPIHKTFASIMQHGLLPHVATLKSITRDLHYATTKHRLKHMPKMQPRHAGAQTLTQQVTAFCVQQVAPALDAVTSLKIMTLSFIEKKQERQREQQEYIPVTQKHEVIMQNDASSPTQPLASPQALQAKTRPPAYANTSLRQRIRVAIRKAMQAQNRPNGTLEEKKNQVLGAALHIWQYNPHLDFENISSVLNQYFDFSRADIAELQNRLWFNRPDEVRQRLAGEGISYAENIEGAETPQEESGHDV